MPPCRMDAHAGHRHVILVGYRLCEQAHVPRPQLQGQETRPWQWGDKNSCQTTVSNSSFCMKIAMLLLKFHSRNVNIKAKYILVYFCEPTLTFQSSATVTSWWPWVLKVKELMGRLWPLILPTCNKTSHCKAYKIPGTKYLLHATKYSKERHLKIKPKTTFENKKTQIC